MDLTGYLEERQHKEIEVKETVATIEDTFMDLLGTND
jgi:hypothetical protein